MTLGQEMECSSSFEKLTSTDKNYSYHRSD